MNRHAEALAPLAACALAASPGNADTWLTSARAASSLGELDKAVAAFAHALSDRSEPRAGARRDGAPDGVRGHGGAGAAVQERFEAVRSRP